MKLKILFFLLISYLFIFSFFTVRSQENLNKELASIVSQGKSYWCLGVEDTGSEQNQWRSVEGTLRLTGFCGDPKGCEIYRYNSNNLEIEEDEQYIKDCQNGKKPPEKCTEEKIRSLQEKIQKSVEANPDWTKIDNFQPNNNSRTNYGDVDVLLSSRFIPHVNYQYYAVGELATAGQEENLTPSIEGNDQTQKLGSFQGNLIFNNDKVKEKCVGITWDPFGRVFDAVSLEPMEDVKVTILDGQTKKPVAMKFNANYSYTNISGVYNILIEKGGNYALKLEELPTHQFVSQVKLNPYYSDVYFNLYYPDQVFFEKPPPNPIPAGFDWTPYHHDIPFQPKSTPYHGAVSEVIKSSLTATDLGSFVNYQGRVSFPKAKVCLIGKDSKKLVNDCLNADKFGNFVFNIDKKDLLREFLVVYTEKVDLTKPIIKSNFFDLKKIDFNSPDLAGFEPILNYVEGIVYQDNKKILSQSEVLIKDKATGKIVYQTKTDAFGKLKISPLNLPIKEFYFEVNGKKINTSDFIKENKEYLEKNKIELITEKVNKKPANNSFGNFNNRPKYLNAPTAISQKGNDHIDKNNLSFQWFLILGIIFILIILGIIVIFYFFKNQSSTHF